MSPPALRPDAFRLLGDAVRLRILRVLARERLNVTELTGLLGLAQSGVSRHLRLLRKGGLVVETREGGWTWLGLAAEAPEGLAGTWAALRQALLGAPDAHGDDARLQEILRARAERQHGWGGPRRPAEPGRSWAAWARALGHLLPALDVADLGCGSGALTLEIARWAGRVDAVDPDPRRLAAAAKAAAEAGVGTITFTRAPLTALPLPDRHVDCAFLSQVLHDLETPEAAVAEAARVTRPGGRVLVLDLLPHRERWVGERLGHRHLGLPAGDVEAWLEAAGLDDVRSEPAARRRGNPFTVLLASGRRRKGT